MLAENLLTLAKPVDLTLENWAEPQFNRWSFLHMDDVIPTALIAAAPRPSLLRGGLEPVTGIIAPRYDADGDLVGHDTVAGILRETYTDAFMVLHRGRILQEAYLGIMTPTTKHLLMSVTKSVVGVVAGILADRGELPLDREVDTIVPELAGSGFAGATTRHLLDMRSGVRFSETYHDPDADVYLMEHAVGWRPPREGIPASLHGYLAGLGADHEHGYRFRYRSSETNTLGWVCERVAGANMDRLIESLIWHPLGSYHSANITVDAHGSPISDGGMSSTLRDAARFGEMLRMDGLAADGTRIAPSWWMSDTLEGGPDSKQAFAASTSPTGMPGGHYRNQIWVPFPDRKVALCLGIHGQMIYVDQEREITAVKFSTWPTPQNAEYYFNTVGAMEAIGAHVNGIKHAPRRYTKAHVNVHGLP